MDKQNDLFLMMFTLSQMNDDVKIIRLFCESLNELFKPYKFKFSAEKNIKLVYSEEINARDISYGYLTSKETPSKEVVVQVQNAVQMLAVILDRLRTENKLESRARSFESIAKKRLDAIKANAVELENSRKKSLNLIENLKAEIAVRGKIEDDLRESEEKYHAIFFNNRTVMMLIDAESGKIFESNPAATAFYGWSPEEFKNMSIFDINTLPKNDVLQKISLAKHKDKNFFHFSHKLKDGTFKEVDVYSWPISINKEAFLFSIILDTTRQVTAERKLEENERRFRSIVENSFEGIGLIDDHFTFTYANENLSILFGYLVEEIVGSEFMNYFAIESRELVKDRHIRRKRGEQVPSRYEVILLRKNGEKVFAEISASTFKSSEGTTQIMVQFIDITERKKAEKKLKEEHDRTIDILENMNDAFVSLDRNWRFTYINKKAGKIFAQNPKDIIGKNIWEEFPEGVGQPFHRNYKKAMNEKVFIRMEEYYLPFDKWFENRINPTEKGIAIFFTDITERKKAEETIKRERDQAQKYLDIAGVMLAMVNAEGEITLMNNKGCEILGYDDATQLLGKNWFKTCIPKSARHEVRAVIGSLMAGILEPIEYYENPVMNKSGEERIIAFHNTIFRDPKGQITGVLFSGEDITKSRQKEEELIESEDKFRSISEYSHSGICLINDQSKFVYVNLKFAEITGYNMSELVNQEFSMVLDERSKSLVEERFHNRRKGEPVQSDYEILILRKDLIVRTMELHVALIQRADGSVNTVAQILDITERKQAEEEIKESAARYKALISVSNTGAWEYHLSTDFLWCSPEYFSMLGRDINEFDLSGKSNLKETWIDLLHPEDRARASQRFAEYLKNGSVGMYENYFRLQHKDGHWVWILSRGRTLRDGNGNITDLTNGTHIDISGQKLAEEEIKKLNAELEKRVIERTAELEKANQELEELNDVFVGREMRIIELKEEIERLKNKHREK